MRLTSQVILGSLQILYQCCTKIWCVVDISISNVSTDVLENIQYFYLMFQHFGW